MTRGRIKGKGGVIGDLKLKPAKRRKKKQSHGSTFS